MSKVKSYKVLEKYEECHYCPDRDPPVIGTAKYLVLLRESPYELNDDKLTINKSVVGCCEKCLDDRNEFQKKTVEPFNYRHKHFVYTDKRSRLR